jgi:hypothetical protein
MSSSQPRGFCVPYTSLSMARAKGKRLAPPRRVVDVGRVAALRAQGFGWKRIAVDLGSPSEPCFDTPNRVQKVGKRFLEPLKESLGCVV